MRAYITAVHAGRAMIRVVERSSEGNHVPAVRVSELPKELPHKNSNAQASQVLLCTVVRKGKRLLAMIQRSIQGELERGMTGGKVRGQGAGSRRHLS